MADYIIEVNQDDFDRLVLQRSSQLPVLVDFWAPWCGPCRVLTPILHKLAEDYGGRFVLATVNTDDNQRLAHDHAIRSIPTVKLIHKGQIVEEFFGVYPESAIRALLDKHIERDSDRHLQSAAALAESGHVDEAIALLHQALTADPDNDRIHPRLAECLIRRNRFDEAAQILRRLPAVRQQDDDIVRLEVLIKFGRIAGDAPAIETLAQIVATNPDDCSTRYRLSAHQVLSGQFAPALDNLLEIVKRDRSYGEDAGRKSLIDVFTLLSKDDPLVAKYRSLLSAALY
jgi:putative thioredoxin